MDLAEISASLGLSVKWDHVFGHFSKSWPKFPPGWLK